jgi:hypothetical protein
VHLAILASGDPCECGPRLSGRGPALADELAQTCGATQTIRRARRGRGGAGRLGELRERARRVKDDALDSLDELIDGSVVAEAAGAGHRAADAAAATPSSRAWPDNHGVTGWSR